MFIWYYEGRLFWLHYSGHRDLGEGTQTHRQQLSLLLFSKLGKQAKNAKATGSTMKFNYILACSGYRIFIHLGHLINGKGKVVPVVNQIGTMP
jgi:hypothetical protein